MVTEGVTKFIPEHKKSLHNQKFKLLLQLQEHSDCGIIV